MKLTLQQSEALRNLQKALLEATEHGLFDVIAAYSHPDTINRFCDDVAEFAIERTLEPHVEVISGTGTKLVLSPVKMTRMPSASSEDWLRFCLNPVDGAKLDEATSSNIQTFMRLHRTEALTDGEENYTLAGDCLAYCDPSAIK